MRSSTTPLAFQLMLRSVTHVPGLLCYLSPRFVPLYGTAEAVPFQVRRGAGAKAPNLAALYGTAEAVPFQVRRGAGAKALIYAGMDGTAGSRAPSKPMDEMASSRALSNLGGGPSKLIDEMASNYSVDLVPGKRQNALSDDHSLYRRKADTWTKTNVFTHARTVVGAGRGDEIRLLKLWRNQKGLDFPSFYLELSVIRALAAKPLPGLVSYNPVPTLSQRVLGVFEYLRDAFPAARIADPANTNNIISDDLTAQEKARVSAAAGAARQAARWEDIVR